MRFSPGVVPKCPRRRGLMFRAEGFAEQRVVEQIDLTDGEVFAARQ